MRTTLKQRALSSPTLCFLCGILIMLGIDTLRRADAQPAQPPQHVYELRMYHAKPGKMDALKTRFADHTDALFKSHDMKSVGYWSPQDPKVSQELFIYILEHPSREE